MDVAGTPAPRTDASMAPEDQAWIKETDSGVNDAKAGVRWARTFLVPAMRKALQEHGGPQQFLMTKMPFEDDWVEYAKILWEMFSPLETHPPALDVMQLPMHHPGRQDSAPGIVHLASLDFTHSCSLKGAPSLKVSLQLLEEIVTDGFVSAGEPILVTAIQKDTVLDCPWKQDHPEDTIGAFGLGFVKGAARICTLHAIILVALEDRVDLKKDRWVVLVGWRVGGERKHGRWQRCSERVGVPHASGPLGCTLAHPRPMSRSDTH